MLSKRVRNCQGSPTLGISAKAKSLAKEGFKVVNFAAGEPDFDPTKEIKQAIISAVDKKGYARYAPVAGIPELKQAIVEKFKKENNILYEPKQILVSCGAKHTLYNIIQAIVDEGDEVIIPSPYWVSYPEQVQLAGGIPVFVDTDENFFISAEKIAEAVSEKTKVIILNSPSNPTGAVIKEEDLRKIAALAVDKGIYVISDEIYEKIIFDREHLSIASFNDDIKALTITVNGLSKSHAMPGLRIGYTGGPEEIITAMSNIQEQSTSNPVSIIQQASLVAFDGGDDEIKRRCEEFKTRRDYLVDALNDLGMKCQKPEGAFYAFPHLPEGFSDSIKFAEQLLEKEKVALVPGRYFGAEEYVRISFATGLPEIKEGITKIKKFINENR